MSGKIEISRETLENSLKDGSSDPVVYASYRKAVADIRALLAAPVVERQEPVMKLEAERLLGRDGEYAVSFVKPGWLDECRRTGGTFFLYTSPPAPVAVVTPDQVEIVAKTIYAQWCDHPGFVPWARNGNSLKQDEARRIAQACLEKVKELNQ